MAGGDPDQTKLIKQQLEKGKRVSNYKKFGGDTGIDADYAEKNHSLDANPEKYPLKEPEDYAYEHDQINEMTTTNDRVLELIAERLKVGQIRYNGNIPRTGEQGRDNLKESLEEALDLAVYLAAEIISILDKRN